MAQISNRLFWFYTMSLLLIWLFVLCRGERLKNQKTVANSIATLQEDPLEMLKNTRNCKSLCDHCGCLAFYCGEECICECNKDNSDTECLATMQTNALKSKAPFELLIQGPSAHRFVRNALQYEQNHARQFVQSLKNHRTTVTIYKPQQHWLAKRSLPAVSANALTAEIVFSPERTKRSYSAAGRQHSFHPNALQHNESKQQKKSTERIKRSTNSQKFDWFSGDYNMNLVRPAPLNKKSEEYRPREEPIKSLPPQRNLFDRSWWSDSAKTMMTPKPLWRNSASSSGSSSTVAESYGSNENNNERIDFPKRISKTFNSFSKSALRGDISNALDVLIKEGADVLDTHLEREEERLKQLREQEDQGHFNFSNSQESDRNGSQEQQEQRRRPLKPLWPRIFSARATTTTTTTTAAPPMFFGADSQQRMPWLRPFKFFQQIVQPIT